MYSEATPPRYSLHSPELHPKCRLCSYRYATPLTGASGSHNVKGPAQNKTPCSRDRHANPDWAGEHVCGSAVPPRCGTMWEGGRKSFHPTSPVGQPGPGLQCAGGALSLLTYRNSNCALTHELPGPGKILQEILETTCSSKPFKS